MERTQYNQLTPEEARTLVRDLNIGALPVPISLLSTESVGASLGAAEKTIKSHRARVMTKMQAGSLSELVRMTLRVRSA